MNGFPWWEMEDDRFLVLCFSLPLCVCVCVCVRSLSKAVGLEEYIYV